MVLCLMQEEPGKEGGVHPRTCGSSTREDHWGGCSFWSLGLEEVWPEANQRLPLPKVWHVYHISFSLHLHGTVVWPHISLAFICSMHICTRLYMHVIIMAIITIIRSSMLKLTQFALLNQQRETLKHMNISLFSSTVLPG
jgi:hypothetical protein